MEKEELMTGTESDTPQAPEIMPVKQKKGFKGLLPKSKKVRRWLKILLILAVVAGVLASCVLQARKTKNTQLSGAYLVETAQRRDLTVSVSGTAALQPADSYKVTTLVSGEILSAPIEEGDLVEKDSTLFTIDGGDAEINAERGQISYQQALEALRPTATMGGILNEVYVRNGDTVAPGTALAKILASEDLYIDFLFTYSSADTIYVGQTATVFIGNFDGSVPGTVVSVSDSSALGSNGMQLRSVRVKVANPGIVSDAFTASATIGSSISYGDAKITMASAAVVYASGSGTVTGFNKLVGSTVKAGEVLCTVESAANRNQLRSAQLGVKSAQNAVDNYRITSPIAGTVIEKKFKAGDTVEGMKSESLAIIFDLSYLKLTMNVDELDIGKVSVGQEVRITADALAGETFSGQVDKISINGTTTNGVTTYPVTIIIKEFGRLMPGMNVSASIIGEELKNVLCIPVDAVTRGNIVMVPGAGAMNAEGTGVADSTKLEERQITVGRNDETYIEVTSGLEDGDTVLVQNQASNFMQTMMGG